jgi:hypothetical protein
MDTASPQFIPEFAAGNNFDGQRVLFSESGAQIAKKGAQNDGH